MTRDRVGAAVATSTSSASRSAAASDGTAHRSSTSSGTTRASGVSRASLHEHQLNLPATEVQKIENGSANLKNDENGQLSSAMSDAGRLIEHARERAGITRKEACSLMFIAEPQYSRWVSGASNDTPSFARLLLLPPQFWFHLNQLLNERFGLRRMLVAQLLNMTADLALAAGE